VPDLLGSQIAFDRGRSVERLEYKQLVFHSKMRICQAHIDRFGC
jgi:hypothetical protein